MVHDVDMADDSLQKQFDLHQQRLEFFSELGDRPVMRDITLPSDLNIGVGLLEQDVEKISKSR